MKETLMRFAKIVAIFLYAFVSIICSAGAMNYGHETGHSLYTIAGIICLLIAGYGCYRAAKGVNDGMV